MLLNAGEMQWIADNLFVGNKLTSGEIHTSSGVRVDLRNISSPIIVLCSWGDDITPPQQALGWITDLYEHEDEIVANGQTIVYTLHQTIGHLGIFVSGKVATKEHAEFASCMDMIDLLPPGLYEAVITEVGADTANPELIHGKYLFRLEARTLDDIRALGGNSEDDNQRFAAAARLSEINLGLYRTLGPPALKAMANGQSGDLMRQLHPNRLRFAAFSDRNPVMAAGEGAGRGRARRPQAGVGRQPAAGHGEGRLDLDHDLLGELPGGARCHDRGCVPGNLRLADAAGHGRLGRAAGGRGAAHRARPRARGHRGAPASRSREALRGRRAARGGAPCDHARPPARALCRRARFQRPSGGPPPAAGQRRSSMADAKAMFRDQYMLLRLDEERAVRAIARLLPDDAQLRADGWRIVNDVLAASGELSDEGWRRLHRIEELFALRAGQSVEGR